MRLVTVQTLLDRTRRAADMKNSNFVTDDELIDRLNTGIAELHDWLVAAYGEDYTYFKQTASLVVNRADYALPADFYKLSGVDLEIDAGRGEFVPACRAGERRRNDLNYGSSSYLRYNLRGRYLTFVPPAKDTRLYQVRYHPTAPWLIKRAFATTDVNVAGNSIALTDHGLRTNDPVRLATTGALPGGSAASKTYWVIAPDGDSIQLAASMDGTAIDMTDVGSGTHTILSMFDGVNGWEEYAVLDAAIYALDKEESESTKLVRRKEAMAARINAMSENRDSGEAPVIQDVYGDADLMDDGMGMMGGLRWPPPA